VDDDTLRFQELGEEVSKLVESDPQGTAALLRRWVEET
jgi:flagellar biosynthesis/type III secretory pathway M-ring protein FliF/YscJ